MLWGNSIFKNTLNNMFKQTVGQSAPPTDMKLSLASKRGESLIISLLSRFVFIEVVNICLLIEITEFFKALALKKNDKKNKTNQGSKICSADRKKKRCESKSFKSLFYKCKIKANFTGLGRKWLLKQAKPLAVMTSPLQLAHHHKWF